MSCKILLSILSMEDRVRLSRIISAPLSIRRQRTEKDHVIVIQHYEKKLSLIKMNECSLDNIKNINPFSEDIGLMFRTQSMGSGIMIKIDDTR